MENSFHMGTFVDQLFRKYHINSASVAKELGVTSQTVRKYMERKVITDDVLRKLTDALHFDLYGMVQAERARLQPAPRNGKEGVVEDPAVKYETKGATGESGFTIIINMSDYDEDTGLRIHKFLMNQPKKAKPPKP